MELPLIPEFKKLSNSEKILVQILFEVEFNITHALLTAKDPQSNGDFEMDISGLDGEPINHASMQHVIVDFENPAPVSVQVVVEQLMNMARKEESEDIPGEATKLYAEFVKSDFYPRVANLESFLEKIKLYVHNEFSDMALKGIVRREKIPVELPDGKKAKTDVFSVSDRIWKQLLKSNGNGSHS